MSGRIFQKNTTNALTVNAEMANTTMSWYRSLPPVLPAEMVGLWKGVGIPSGHPLDGVLENLQWFGKRFHPDMRADALLFQSGKGRLVAVEPRWLPVWLALGLAPFGRTSVARYVFGYLHKALKARGRTATLELRSFEGTESAAMVYDHQPIVDHFRRIDDVEVAGMMIVKDDPRRYFFKLRRIDAAEMLT